MLFKILLNYMRGYFYIQLEGYYIERFINVCMRKGIFLWKISRTKSTILFANVSNDGIEEAKKIAIQDQCRLTILKEKGIPYLIKKYKKRRLFFILLLIVTTLIIVFSKFVWHIDVEGNTSINAQDLIEIANEEGLKNGVLKSKVDIDKIANRIRMEKDNVAWIAIDMKGTNAIIKIVESEPKPKLIDESDFSNIVAIKDGIITKITAQNGTAMFKEGDQVKKGDILISGWMEGKYTGKYYVNSNGEVKAKIIYAQNEKIDKKTIKKEQTGKSESKYQIKVNNFKINLYKRLSKFKKYDTIYSSKKVRLFPNFYLPIDIITVTNYEVNEEEIDYDKSMAKTTGEAIASEKIDKLIDGEVINKNTEITEYNDYYDVKVIYEVIENIGTKEKIEF